MVDAATNSIVVAQFYVVSEPGKRMEPILNSIEAAAKRGVRVRFLLDAKFAKTYPDGVAWVKSVKEIELEVLDLDAMFGGVLHAKYFIVDGKDAYLGSQNFDWRSLEHIVELGVRIREPSLVDSLGAVFERDWALARGEESTATTRGEFPVATTFAGDPVGATPGYSPKPLVEDQSTWDLPMIVKMIDSAEKRVRVQLMSYSVLKQEEPKYWAEIDGAFRRAAARGVAVELIVGDWAKDNPRKMATLTSLHMFQNTTVRMATIPQPAAGPIPFARVIHSKFMTVDDRHSWIGTSNWSAGYFYKSRNVGLVVEGASFNCMLQRVFEDLWNSPYAYDVFPCFDRLPGRVGFSIDPHWLAHWSGTKVED
jgi:phosphatidylserine/phosphatidylglycerophosphate/cardiolipin synthase-like enzyme